MYISRLNQQAWGPIYKESLDFPKFILSSMHLSFSSVSPKFVIRFFIIALILSLS